MLQTRIPQSIGLCSGLLAVVFTAAPLSAQAPNPKSKLKAKEKSLRTVTYGKLTRAQADEKVRELSKPDDPQNKFFLKSIDVTVGQLGVRYRLTFQTYLPRTNYALAANRLALEQAIREAKAHGGILITDLKAYQYNRRTYFAYVSRVIAQRQAKLNFRVIPDLPNSIYKETINLQQKFGRRLVRSSKYTDRNDKIRHAMLFVDRTIELNKPNFRNRKTR